MSLIPANIVPVLYAGFHSPITILDCGAKCSPYNENGVPFCCDTHHAVPTAYHTEWQFLKSNTDLWHEWRPESAAEKSDLQAITPSSQVLIECQGHQHCQRQFRSLTCRAFPFFPYVNLQGEFIGLSYYWEYEDRCWVISNLGKMYQEYRQEFIHTYDSIFEYDPEEKANFRYHAIMMRRIFGRRHRAIPLLHRNGGFYKISPGNGRLRRVKVEDFPTFYPYKLAIQLPFPDEE